MSCDVCCEQINKSNHALVICPFCPFSACVTCHERYLCDTVEDAHCMSCRKGWTRETLVDNFTQKFVSKTYKQRREDLLFERERSLMPATQPYVELERRIRSLNPKIAELKKRRDDAHQEWNRVSNLRLAPLAVEHGVTTEFEASIIRHRLAQEERKVVSNIQFDIDHLEWQQVQLMNRLHGGQVEHEKRQFVRACPFADCKGFLSTVWKCGMCENWACPECHEVKGPNKDSEHTCDPNNVATAQLLAKDSRNCPKCAAMIFKINGCDQMYCTQCHTAFSWRTGRIETGTVHNPHYYEYMRARGTLARNPGDVPCGGFPDYVAVLTNLRNMPRADSRYALIANAHRAYGHCQWAVIPRYDTNRIEDNRDLRIKFMIGDISNDIFKSKIQQREKARQRKTDIRNVMEMLLAVLNDLFQAFVQDKEVDTLCTSLRELQNHVNLTLDKISTRYTKCAVPRIGPNFHMY